MVSQTQQLPRQYTSCQAFYKAWYKGGCTYGFTTLDLVVDVVVESVAQQEFTRLVVIIVPSNP